MIYFLLVLCNLFIRLYSHLREHEICMFSYVVWTFTCVIHIVYNAPHRTHSIIQCSVKLLYEFLCECGCFYWCCVCHSTISRPTWIPHPPFVPPPEFLTVYKLKVTFNRRLEFIWCVWANQFVKRVFVLARGCVRMYTPTGIRADVSWNWY